jgi:sestrin
LPIKLKNLAEVNAILAHQPWRLRSEHIERLLKGQEAWSLPELVHAFVILASYRALAAFVWGMGITSEIDFKYKDSPINPSTNASSGTVSPPRSLASTFEEELIQVNTNTSMLINKLCQISGEMLLPLEDEALEKKVELFAAAGKCNSVLRRPTDTSIAASSLELESNGWTAELSNQFSEPHYSNKTYVDFDVKSTEYNIFHVQDFSWGTHGFSLVKRYYSSAANLLDECFKCIRNLTYQSFHDQEAVETGPFRMAIWYYVHRIFGIFHDDFDYRQVNLLVPLSIKSYIKNMASMPWRLTCSHLSHFGIHLKPQEKAHIALLVMEARKQSELIYALHAINKYLAI